MYTHVYITTHMYKHIQLQMHSPGVEAAPPAGQRGLVQSGQLQCLAGASRANPRLTHRHHARAFRQSSMRMCIRVVRTTIEDLRYTSIHLSTRARMHAPAAHAKSSLLRRASRVGRLGPETPCPPGCRQTRETRGAGASKVGRTRPSLSFGPVPSGL